jgi:hypothetical protein
MTELLHHPQGGLGDRRTEEMVDVVVGERDRGGKRIGLCLPEKHETSDIVMLLRQAEIVGGACDRAHVYSHLTRYQRQDIASGRACDAPDQILRVGIQAYN